MEKKKYVTPTLEEVKMGKMGVLCASGPEVFDETIEVIGGPGAPGAIAE